jgi:hypothetical protein
MKYKLIFRDKAVFEMEDAYEYYESKSKDLGKKLLLRNITLFLVFESFSHLF